MITRPARQVAVRTPGVTHGQTLRLGAQQRSVFRDPLSLLLQRGRALPAQRDLPANPGPPSRGAGQHSLPAPGPAPARGLGWMLRGRRPPLDVGQEGCFKKGASGKWPVPQLLGQAAHSTTARARERGSWGQSRPVGGDAAERRSREKRGRDGDFLCSQGPERHFWVN